MAMTSLSIEDDKDLDDAALWAVIDSAAASYTSPTTTAAASITTATIAATTRFRKPQTLKTSPHVILPPSPSPPSNHKNSRHYTFNGGSPRANSNSNSYHYNRPEKMAKSEISSPDLAVVKRVPVMPLYSSPDSEKFSVKEISPFSEKNSPHFEYRNCEDKEDKFKHCLSGRFPTVSLFKDYQNAAMELLEKSDYTMISGSPFIKKTGWRKIAFYFNVSFEIKDKDIEFDENRNVQRAEFVVRAYMQGGRFSDGWGSCERREKRFLKPNNDIPSTAETRAKNKACQDLLGIGAYRPSVSHAHSPR